MSSHQNNTSPRHQHHDKHHEGSSSQFCHPEIKVSSSSGTTGVKTLPQDDDSPPDSSSSSSKYIHLHFIFIFIYILL